ncbi:hypothetical protein ADUPG1_007225 [Aduncisulcus paluster]|uniref:Uncharacterized protein n=1 Tax=Aduncisulcus paluster TaxID=2918883 RepID=A0ABQ5KPL1_9EUKA|nr:hypothetical protein ADUPG1_007225 [Aduncisulcus paluster]
MHLEVLHLGGYMTQFLSFCLSSSAKEELILRCQRQKITCVFAISPSATDILHFLLRPDIFLPLITIRRLWNRNRTSCSKVDSVFPLAKKEARKKCIEKVKSLIGGKVVIVEDSSEDELIPFVSDNIEDEESEEVSRVADNIHRHDLPQILDSSSLTSGIGKRRASDSESERYRKKKASQKDGSRRQVIQSRKWIDRTLGYEMIVDCNRRDEISTIILQIEIEEEEKRKQEEEEARIAEQLKSYPKERPRTKVKEATKEILRNLPTEKFPLTVFPLSLKFKKAMLPYSVLEDFFAPPSSSGCRSHALNAGAFMGMVFQCAVMGNPTGSLRLLHHLEHIRSHTKVPPKLTPDLCKKVEDLFYYYWHTSTPRHFTKEEDMVRLQSGIRAKCGGEEINIVGYLSMVTADSPERWRILNFPHSGDTCPICQARGEYFSNILRNI